jgi:hypothetical protein
VSLQNPRDFAKFRLAKSLVPTQLYRPDPEFCLGAALVNMNMGWLVRFGTVKPNTIAFLPQNRRHFGRLNHHSASDKPVVFGLTRFVHTGVCLFNGESMVVPSPDDLKKGGLVEVRKKQN